MKKLTLLLLLLFVLPYHLSAACTGWYNTDWGFRKTLTTDNTKVSGAGSLTNFPTLFDITTDNSLRDTANGGNVGKSNGGDILFTTSDSSTKLDHEIQIYTASTGRLLVWVEIDSVSSTVDTDICMYYGNPSAADQWNIAGTWSNGYAGVWHLEETPPSSAVVDSSGNNTNGATNVLDAADQVAGQFAGAINGDGGVGEEIQVADQTAIKITGALTVSMWLNGGAQSDNGIVTKYDNVAGQRSYAIGSDSTDTNELQWNYQRACGSFTTDDQLTTSAANVLDSTWRYVVGVFNPSTYARVYVDGTQNVEDTTTIQSAIADCTEPLFILSRGGIDASEFTGTIDEVRISNVVRSNDWILTEYNNQSSPSTFYSVGSEESSTGEVKALDAAVATTGNAETLSYSVSAGTNRYLEVGVGCELNCDNSPTVDIGGQTPVELRTCAVINLGRITVFGLNEAGIAARTGDLITVSGSGTRTIIIARSKEGVNQTNPIPETDCDFTSESTPNPITTSVINATMNASVSSFAFNGTGSDAAVPPNTCAWVNTTLRETENGTSEALSFADTFPTVSGNVNPQCTWDEQPRAIIVSYEVAPHIEVVGEAGPSVSTINVYEAIFNSPFVVFPQNLPNGDAGEVYVGATITAIGGVDPFTWSISSGGLPTGLSISSTTGEISGTIDAGVVEGNKEFVVQALDVNGGKATGDFVIFVSNPVDPDPPFEPPPWVQPYDTFTPSTTHYVSPSGTGSGSGLDASNTESWATAKGHYACNQLHILRAGTYETSTRYNPVVDCTSGNMAIFKGYIVPLTGELENAEFRSGIHAQGNWNWFWGLNLNTLGSTVAGLNPAQMECSGCRLINNVIHDANGSTTSMFNFGPGMALYGNILYRAGLNPSNDRGHAVYTQNSSSNGVKYYVQNYFSFCDAVGRGQCINALTSGSRIQNMHFQDNFWWNGEDPLSPRRARINFMIEGTDANAEDMRSHVFKNNFIIDVNESNGWGFVTTSNAAWQGEWTGNYLAKSTLAIQGLWGVGSPAKSTIENNKFYDAHNGCHFKQIGSNTPTTNNGAVKFMDQDVVDNNTFGGTFKACGLKCNGATFGDLTLAQWRTNTDNCRVTPDAGDANGFDINSTEVANPTVNEIKVIRNDYSRVAGEYRGQVGIVNWESVTSDIVDIAPLGLAGKTYVVRYARDFYGTTAASGTCPGSGACDVTLATKTTDAGAAGQFYSHFIVIGQPDAP